MGFVRGLKPAEKARVRSVREKQGILVSDATQDTITTDALGNAQNVVNVSDGPVTTEITLTDTADSTDTATGGPNVIATSLMAPVIIVAPSTLP